MAKKLDAAKKAPKIARKAIKSVERVEVAESAESVVASAVAAVASEIDVKSVGQETIPVLETVTERGADGTTKTLLARSYLSAGRAIVYRAVETLGAILAADETAATLPLERFAPITTINDVTGKAGLSVKPTGHGLYEGYRTPDASGNFDLVRRKIGKAEYFAITATGRAKLPAKS